MPLVPQRQQHLSNLCLRLPVASPFVSVSSPLLCLTRTLIIGCGAHLGNLGCARLEIFKLITSAEPLFPGKVTGPRA